jgi:aryl-alcohol dehydrogenase-like predicted oxidoreductase
VAEFEHLGSGLPILILGFSIALIWQVAIPRGILQGLQRFTALASNLGLELVVRTSVAFGLLTAGYAVSGAMAAVFTGLAFCFALTHPRLSSVLFGATTPEQVYENVNSLGIFMTLDDSQRARLVQLASS